MILAGGETAEMPDLYQGDHFDLAGFAIGTVTQASLIDGLSVKGGDAIIGVASSGIHSNGLSLARKLIGSESAFYKDLLMPTNIYCRPAAEIFAKYPGIIKGMAHITGGGWTNIGRISKSVGYEIDKPLSIPPLFNHLFSQVEDPNEMYHTFNMGMGLTLICESGYVQKVLETFVRLGFEAARIGTVVDNFNGIKITEGITGRSAPLDLAFSNKT
jgi:phosphoribosylformylglycinamidine cyclo-ligase